MAQLSNGIRANALNPYPVCTCKSCEYDVSSKILQTHSISHEIRLIHFTTNICFMHENLMKKILPLGRRSNGLYYVQRNVEVIPKNKYNYCAQEEQHMRKVSTVQEELNNCNMAKL